MPSLTTPAQPTRHPSRDRWFRFTVRNSWRGLYAEPHCKKFYQPRMHARSGDHLYAPPICPEPDTVLTYNRVLDLFGAVSCGDEPNPLVPI